MTELKRAMRLPHAIAMVVGIIIGASIFVQPSEVTTQVHSVGMVLLVWLAAGALTLIGSLVCAELASIYTRSGGVYVYLKESLHPSLGFLWGWAMLLTMHSGIIAAIATVFARYVGFFVPLSPSASRLVAVALILLLSAINLVGVKEASRVQTLFTGAKLIAVLLIVIVGFVLGTRVDDHFIGSSTAPGETVGGFLRAMVAGLFAYGGWHMVTYSSEETVDPRRTIPRALLVGTVIVTLAYMAMNAVYLYVIPLDRVAASTRVAADLGQTLLGASAGGIVAAIVLVSTFGAANGVILAGPRAYYAMAQDGLLFQWLGAIHPRYGTPHRAIALQAVWSSLLVATGTFRALFTRVVYTEWIFFGLMAVGLMVLRRRRVRRDYSVWGYPVLPLIFIVSSFAVAINAMISTPKDAAMGLGMVLAGVPVYWLWARRAERERALRPSSTPSSI
jgi:basic amino acid/polyamine antiporter, APA family